MDLNLEAFDGVLTEPPNERGENDSGSQATPSEKKLLAVTLHHNDDDDSDESRVPPPVGLKSETRSCAVEEGPAIPVTPIASNAVARLDATLQDVFEDICITFYSASRLPTPEEGSGAFVDERLEKRLAGLRFLDPVVEQDFIVFWNRPAHATRLVLSYLLVVFCVFSPDHDATTTALRRAAAGLITVLFALAASHYYYQRRQLKSEADALDRIATTRDDASLLKLRLQLAEVLRTRERLEGVAILIALMVVQITAPLLNHEDCINPEVVCPRGLHPRQVCVLVACATGTMRCVVKIPLILMGGVTFGIASLVHDPTSAQPPSTWSLAVFMGMVCCVLIAFSFASECSGRVHFERDFRRQVKGRMTVARHHHFDSIARCAMPRLLRSRAAEALAGPDGSTVPVTEAACAVVLCEMPQLLTWMTFLPQSSIGQATHAIQTALDVEANAFGVDKVSTTFGCLVYAVSGSAAKSAAEAFAARAPGVARAALAAAIDDRYYSELSDIAVEKFCMVTAVGLGSAVFSVVGSGVLVPYLTGSALANAALALADARLRAAPLPPLASSHNVLRRQHHCSSKVVAPLAQQWQRTFVESGSHDTALFDVLQQTTSAAVNGSLNEDATMPKTTTAAGLSSSGGPVTTSSKSALSASSAAEGGKGVFLYRQGHCSEVTAAKRKQKWNSMYADEVVQREYVEFAAAEDALTGRYSLAGQLAFYASLIAVALVETTSSGSVSEPITDVGPPLYAAVLLGCCILLIAACLGIVIQRREVLPQAVEAGICFSCAALCCSFPLLSHRISWLNSSESLAACLAPLLFTAMKRIPTAYMVLLFLGGLVLPVLACNTNIAVNPEDAILPAVLVAVLGFAVLRGNCAGPALASLFETMLDIRTLIAVLEQQSAAHLDLLQNMFPEPIAESIQQSIAATARDVTDPDPEVAAAATMPPLWVAHPGRDPSCISDTESLAEHWCGTGPLDQRRYIAPNTIVVELNVRREDPLEGTAESQRFSFMHSRQADPSSSTGLGRAYGDSHAVLQAIVLHFERYNCDGHLQVVNVTGDRVQVAGPFLALGMSRKACSELPIAVAHAATRALLKLDTVLEPYKACATGVCVAAGAATTLIGALPRTFVVMGAAPEESSRLLSAVPEIGTCAFWATERFVNTFSQAAFLAANEQERLTVLVPHWARSGGAWVKPAFARWKVRGSPITNMRILRSSPEEEVEQS